MKILLILAALIAVTLGKAPDYPSPTSVNDIKPELRFFRRAKQEITIPHGANCASLPHSRGFLNAAKLVFIVHGFRNTGDDKWMHGMKDALIRAEDQTVVIVDWRGGAEIAAWKYEQASSSTRTVGRWLADCVNKIKAAKPSIYIHGIGHSLGAHILGMAGRWSGKFDRISGLDPAGPDFTPGSDGYESGMRGLRKTDAKRMVDVIHTDGCCNINLGTFQPMGTVDFYPNYGYRQPGVFIWGGSHSRAETLYTWSISNKGKFRTNSYFLQEPTESQSKPHRFSGVTVEMGYHADAGGARPAGLYFIDTARKAPWVK